MLTWPHNYYNAIAVETAYKMGLPPTSLFTDKQPGEGWSREDKKLAMAWTVLQKETCQKCGQPLWICRSSNKNLSFKTKKDICYSDAEHQKNMKKQQFKNLKPGEYAYTVPYMLDNSRFPSRAEYLKGLNED